jgi:hypothetical protein
MTIAVWFSAKYMIINDIMKYRSESFRLERVNVQSKLVVTLNGKSFRLFVRENNTFNVG